MSPKTREMLDRIDEFLATNVRESRELWDVLTALRGPDSIELGDKLRTTIPIRIAAFPRTAAATDDSSGAKSRAIFEGSIGDFKSPDHHNYYTHFNSHAVNAARVLDILED